MCAVGVGAATASAGNPVCGAGIGTACCGMPQVTISGAKTSIWIYAAAGVALYLLLSKRRRG